MRKRELYIGGAILLIGFVVMFAGRFTGSPASAGTWQDTDIACLNGHANAAQHIHADLSITMDGEPQPVPANVGINNTCMAEVHTHDASGELHIETVTAGQTRTLGEFFTVWNTPINRDGYTLEATVDGSSVATSSLAQLPLADGQQIELSYTSANEN